MDYHLLKRKKKSGTVYYVAFLSDIPGKKKYHSIKSTGVGNKALAHKIAQKMHPASTESLGYFLDFWNPEKSEYLKSETIEGRKKSTAYVAGNRSIIERYFLPYFEERGIKKLSDLNRQTLLAWRNHLFETGVGPRTINRVRTAVWVALQWAVDMEMLPHHPGAGVKPVKAKPKEQKIFKIAELEELFQRPWPDFRCYAACLLAAYTGMRIGEVRGLLVQNLHLDSRYLDVLTNYQDEEGLKPPKWDSERVGVTLPPPLIKALERVLSLHRWGARPEHFVFFSTDSPDWPLNKHTLGTALKRACKAAKIPPRTFHVFRHSFVSHVSPFLSPAALQYHVGHSNAETTERYQHITEGDRKALQDAQNRILPFKKKAK